MNDNNALRTPQMDRSSISHGSERCDVLHISQHVPTTQS